MALPCGPMYLRAIRHGSIGVPLPPCRSTRWWQDPFASVSFDTAAFVSLCKRVVRYVSEGFPVPTCRSTHRRRVPCANASFDTPAASSLCQSAVRHVGIGHAHPLPSRRRWLSAPVWGSCCCCGLGYRLVSSGFVFAKFLGLRLAGVVVVVVAGRVWGWVCLCVVRTPLLGSRSRPRSSLAIQPSDLGFDSLGRGGHGSFAPCMVRHLGSGQRRCEEYK
jgi:hypothetical protein